MRTDDHAEPEPQVRKIVFGGDTHGDAGQVRWLLQKAKTEEADAVFVLGDFGVWNHLDDGEFIRDCAKAASREGVLLFFLPGNHENYDLLEEWEADHTRTADGFVLVRDGVYYSPRGHRWTWSGVKFLSLGGAYSVDKDWRVIEDEAKVRRAEARLEGGYTLSRREMYALKYKQLSWWRQEEINDEERDRAMEGGEVDIMLTHDKPLKSEPQWNRKNIAECVPNQEKVQAVVDKTRPNLLLHGHLHHAYEDYLEDSTTFVLALDCDPHASISSGGSGLRHLSYAVLDIQDASYRLHWRDEADSQISQSFILKSPER